MAVLLLLLVVVVVVVVVVAAVGGDALTSPGVAEHGECAAVKLAALTAIDAHRTRRDVILARGACPSRVVSGYMRPVESTLHFRLGTDAPPVSSSALNVRCSRGYMFSKYAPAPPILKYRLRNTDL